MVKQTLGLVMILKNEAHNLKYSLEPLAGLFDEMVVVDTGSSDDTPRICTHLGAKVFFFKWIDDFAAARNHGLMHAQSDWLLWLDADNAMPPESVTILRSLLPAEKNAIIWAREYITSTGGHLWQKRCFPRSPAVRFHGRVHEQLMHPADWRDIASPVIVKHWGYEDPARVKAKGSYYLELLQRSLADDPSDFYSHFQAARCLANLRRFDEAADHLWQAKHSKQAPAQNSGLWVQANADLARLLERQGRHETAAEILDHVLEALPRSALAHFHRGRLAHAMGQWQSARHHLELAVKLGLDAPIVDLDPIKTQAQAGYFLGQALWRLGELVAARVCFEQTLDIMPGNLVCRAQLAKLLLEQNDAANARGQAETMLRLRPGDPTALRLLRACQEAP